MPTHTMHPAPDARAEFLVDGCDRCEEHVLKNGADLDAERFAAFWRHMIDVEFGSGPGATYANAHAKRYASDADAALGHRLYTVAVCLQRAFGLHPSDLRFDGRP